MKIMKIKKIKRLIKKAEFIEGIESGLTNSGMLSIYKNPTAKEIEEAKSESYGTSIRGVILDDGTKYCWNGIMLHDEMPKDFVPNEAFRFAYEYNEWIFDLHRYFSIEQGMKKCLELKSTLQQFGNFAQNDYITIFYPSDNGLEYRKYDKNEEITDNVTKNCVGFCNLSKLEEFMNRMDNYEGEGINNENNEN